MNQPTTARDHTVEFGAIGALLVGIAEDPDASPRDRSRAEKALQTIQGRRDYRTCKAVGGGEAVRLKTRDRVALLEERVESMDELLAGVIDREA